ncbi:signal peptidase I [Dysosmobacter sp.]|uniref:signal peptidase I n=1 Tax=Dysosmobacter sp. TaxID=2591382 RepID=UPI002A8D903B|nr:signal peptidase I [Dysosmobacter sp.]MDY3282878.1 signal peptidase I [Dysosmobacter sp.]
MEKQAKVCTGENGREWYEWIQILVWTVLVIVGIFTVFCRMLGVDGHSMVPTLQHGDLMMVTNPVWAGDYGQGDVVIVSRPDFNGGRPVVKRVIATAGQTVDIDFGSGSVFVDGRLLEEPYIAEPTYLSEGMVFPLTVPEGRIFLMGDNRNNSDDSRDPRLGTVDVRSVIGKAVVIAFPGISQDSGRREFSRVGAIC